MLWFRARERRSWGKQPNKRPAQRLRPQRSLRVEQLESRTLMAVSVAPLAVPALSSRPGAPASLYLDFNGNIEKQWGSHTNVVTPPYDTDGNPASFSAGELAAIHEIWSRVAEDYAPFNLNVTTLPPPVIAPHVAARVAIGGSYSDWYRTSAGGVSYVGGFAGNTSDVAFVFSNTLNNGNPRFVAEAVSHEAGHLFGLEHQAAWSSGKLVSQYNTGTTAWAPIMGDSYYAERTTWANGPTPAGPTANQDELAVIASSANGFGYAPDDYGNSLTTAAALPLVGSAFTINGLIGASSDRDVFKFATGGGALSVALDIAPYGPDLDGVVELDNTAGQTIAIANPSSSLNAALATTLTAGTYYVVVHSSGGYGNLGRYTLHGTITAPLSSPVGTPPPPSSSPPPTTSGIQIIDNGAAGFTSTGAWQTLSGAGYSSDTQYAPANGTATASWTFAGLAPGQYRIAAAWSGSALNATDAPFSILSGSRLLATARVSQQRAASTFTASGASWQNLGTVTITGNTITVRLNSSLTARVVADAVRLERVYASTGGAAAS
jgi:hypothetical protein